MPEHRIAERSRLELEIKNMNEIMKFFGQQPANGDSFDEIKISIASPEQIRSWSTAKSKSPRPSTIVLSNRKETACSVPAFSDRSKITNVCAANTRE